MKISIFYKKGALEEAEIVRKKAEECDLKVCSFSSVDQFSESSEDVVVIIGGDGSFLRIANQTEKRIALLRYESFGFFASWSSERAEELFEELKQGKFSTIKLGKIEAEFSNRRELAINEFFMRGCNRSVNFHIGVNGGLELSFKGDGVIVYTPAGSAGHAFSFGGPLLHPAMDAFAALPVAPIRKNLRTMVFNSNVELLVESSEDLQLIADGQRFFMTNRVVIKRSDKKVTLIKKESFDEKLRRLTV